MNRKRKKYPGVRKRGERSFQINYYVCGKRITETVEASTEGEAYSARTKRLATASASSQSSKEDNRVSFEQAMERYLAHTGKTLTGNTQQRSLCIFNHLCAYLEQCYPQILYVYQLDLGIAKKYKDFMLNSTKKIPSGVNTDIDKLRAIFNVFLELSFIKTNPFIDVDKISLRLAKPKKKHLPSDYEIMQILEETEHDPSYREITRFLVRVGRRIEETSLYKKSDVMTNQTGDPIKILVRPEVSKMREPGEITLDDELARTISETIQKNPKSEFLFTNNRGRKIAQNSYRLFLKDVCQKRKLKDITPHCFRYFVCNRLLNAGVNLKDAMSVTGHTDFESFMSYIKSTEVGKQKALSVTRLENIK